MAFQLALGCRTVGYGQEHRECCNRCFTCEELFERYGYTNLATSGLHGPIDLYRTGDSETWDGFNNGSLAIPSLNSGTCSDSIIEETGMSGLHQWYFDSSDPVKFYAGASNSSFPGPYAIAFIEYGCTLNIPSRTIVIQIYYYVYGNVAAEFDEGDFTDWTWTNIFTGGDGRKATKTLGDGSVVEWYNAWAGPGGSGGGPRKLSATISHIDFDLSDGVAPITSLSIPAVPYDYLGVLTGTVTIS